jgi:hypothetical protein
VPWPICEQTVNFRNPRAEVVCLVASESSLQFKKALAWKIRTLPRFNHHYCGKCAASLRNLPFRNEPKKIPKALIMRSMIRARTPDHFERVAVLDCSLLACTFLQMNSHIYDFGFFVVVRAVPNH